ncbi:MAG: sulfatase [Gemmatimonadota bacterium]|nr:MAG: sulfatase [Gemmatimonadota bacterium]
MSRVIPVTAMVALALASTACQTQDEDAPRDRRDPDRAPNIIIIVVDDMRWDEMGIAGHPYLETPHIDALANDGAFFSNAFHAVPLCSPNRASILTGQYPSRHGIIDNVARNRMSHRLETFPQALQRAGYITAFFGKWHMGNDPTPRPGFDEWAAIPGQGRTIDPELYEEGRIHTVEGYITDVLTDRAVSVIDRDLAQPFFIYIGHKAIHPDAIQLDDGSVDLSQPRAYVPAPRHRGRYDDSVFTRRPNVVSSPEELTDKPALRRALLNKNSAEMVEMFGLEELDPGTSEETIRRRAEMLLAVDESLGRIVAALEARGILDETFILFTSDNGFFYGEHGLSLERRLPYEESTRTPLLVRYPGLARGGSRIDDLVTSVDIAPTMLEIAGVPIGDQIQGRSLVPLLRGDASDWRQSVLIEFYTYENPFPWLVDMDYRAIRTKQFKYIHWMQHPDENELYDLVEDPFETENLIADTRLANVVAGLREQMAAAVLDAMGLGN